MTGCRFVHDHQAEHAVSDLCRVIDLPRSTYYAWLNYQPSQRERGDNVLLSEIKDIHTLSRHTYGAPQVLGQLRHRGHRVGRHRVARIMDRCANSPKSQLRTIIFEYVEVFYNRERHQAIPGHLTPAEYYATAKVA